jgi:hypothetical protein
MTFDEAVTRIVDQAGGDDRIIQEVASAFGSRDSARIQQVMSQYGGGELTADQIQDFEQRFQARYQADPVTGRYWT